MPRPLWRGAAGRAKRPLVAQVGMQLVLVAQVGAKLVGLPLVVVVVGHVGLVGWQVVVQVEG